MTMDIVRTRFAPSPSGHLHIGGARTALFCWAYARQQGGRFILRIEDTDQKRSSAAASVGFLDDLAWLGIGWDEGPEHDGFGGGDAGPYFCSQRLDIYHHHVNQLIEAGKAYRAFETPEQIQAAREAARQKKQQYQYDRASLNLDEATVQQYLEEGRPYVVRLRLPDDLGDVTFDDQVVGTVTTDRQELDDFVILKADGYPTYHFAVVVDDELMGVTHVIRGQEHLNNTARHIVLQQALGFRRPVYAHVSVIFNPDGSKMSKRDKDRALRKVVQERGLDQPPTDPDTGQLVLDANEWNAWLSTKERQLEIDTAQRIAELLEVSLPEINVDEFRRAGYLPDVLVNYLALLGWSPGGDVEQFDREFFVKQFSFDRLIKSPARFDRDKLLAFNLDAIQALPPEQFVEQVREHGRRYHPEYIEQFDEQQFDLFARINQDRSKTLDDPFRSCRFFMLDDEQIDYEDTKAVRKALANGDPNGFTHLEQMYPLLEQLDSWTVAGIDATVHSYAEEHADGKLGKVAQPLRIAVTGGTMSPAIFETLALLGKDRVLNRITRCLSIRQRYLSTA